MKRVQKKYIFLIILWISMAIVSGCISIPRYPDNSDLIMKSIQKAASRIHFSVQKHVKKKSRIAILDLDTSPVKTYTRLNLLFEEALISILTANGLTVIEGNENILRKIDRLSQKTQLPDYILAYRILKCGVIYNELPDYRYLDREAVVILNLRLVDGKSANILWAESIEEIENDKISRRAVINVESSDWKFSGYNLLDLKPVEPLNRIKNIEMKTRSSNTLGLFDRISVGAGFTEWDSVNMTVSGAIGYNVLRGLDVSLNAGYFPYSIIKRILYEDKYYNGEYKGQVIPIYLSGEFRLISYSRVSPYLTAGFGAYIHIGDVEVPDYISGVPLPEGLITSFSGSEIAFGMNGGIGVKISLSGSFELNMAAEYHYTGYEFGNNFQFLRLGINYNF